MLIPPLRIVLSGGGIRAVAHSGSLKALEEEGMLKSVKEYVGVSAGAMLALCLSIGYSVETLASLCLKFDFTVIRTLEPETMLSFFETLGLDSGHRLQRLIESILHQKGLLPTTTFSEIPNLRIFASDLMTCEPREFSATKTPNANVVRGLLASMCIPGYFTPVTDEETGHILIDGAALHNFPLAFLSAEEQKTALGITFSEEHTRVEKIENIFEYFQQIYACFYLPRTFDVWEKNKGRVIILPCGDFPMWDFEASSERRATMIKIGYDATKKFIKTPQTAPLRRMSCS
jgi:NTE family protein